MARWTEEIILIDTIKGRDDDGFDVVEEESGRLVYADMKSVTRTEFYLANQSGIKADISFVLRQADYDSEMTLLHGEKKYKVIRTYKKDGETIDLICTDITEAA